MILLYSFRMFKIGKRVIIQFLIMLKSHEFRARRRGNNNNTKPGEIPSLGNTRRIQSKLRPISDSTFADKKKNNAALCSAAFQDHYEKTINIELRLNGHL